MSILSNGRGFFMASGRRGLPTASVNQSGGGCTQSRDRERYAVATVGSGTERTKDVSKNRLAKVALGG